MAQQINFFHKGISSDPDYSKRLNDVWDFPTLNIRVLNKEGQGFIITNLDGNTNNTTGYDFQISSGYFIIGACEYNGIAYIFSMNSSNGFNEIGCFPSPNTLDYDGNGPAYSTFLPPIFQRQYRPLMNFTYATAPYDITTPRAILNPTYFNWDSTRQIDVFAREDYDNTVNLYFCDWLNPNRVINSGFDQQGNIKNRLYNAASFNTTVNQFLTTSTQLSSQLKIIEDANGALKYGNYIFYFRYVNASQNSTPFILEDGPCQIFQGNVNSLSSPQGGTGISPNDVSDKIVTFDMSDIDTTYAFIEVAYTRYYSDASLVVQPDTFLIVHQFPITTTSMPITITGKDIEIPITIADITTNISLEDRCKSHCHVDNIYWGANWKGIQIDDDILVDFAKLITTTYDDTLPIDLSTFYGNEGNSIKYDLWTQPTVLNTARGQYKDYWKTYDYVGYFRTESYAFGVCFELVNGSLTSVYPVQAYDELELTQITATTNGVHRFPRVTKSNLIKADQKGHVMGIKFNCLAAFSLLLGSNTTSAWFSANVRSMYFVRSERYVNMLYQGLAMNCVVNCLKNGAAHIGEDWDLTQKYSINAKEGAAFQGDINYNPDDEQQAWSNNYIGQVPGEFAGSGQQGPESWDIFWGHEAKPPTHIENFPNNPNNGKDYILEELYHIPIYKGYMPMTFFFDNTSGNPARTFTHSANYISRFPLRKPLIGIYSPDGLFAQSIDLSLATYIEKIYSIPFTETHDSTITGSISIWPHVLLADTPTIGLTWDVTYDNSITRVFQSNLGISNIRVVGKQTLSKPDNNTLIGTYMFVNGGWDRADDHDSTNTIWYMHKNFTTTSNRYLWTTRSMISPDYIGLVWDDVNGNCYGTTDDMNNSIVSIYKQRPLTTDSVSIYNSNPSSTQYYKISNAIRLYDQNGILEPAINSTNSYVCYHGDCFLQKTYFKQLVWNGSDNWDSAGGIIVDGNTITRDYDSGNYKDFPENGLKHRYTHGLVIGIVTENMYNTAMRYDSTLKYYPDVALNTFAFEPPPTGQEAFLYNAGYHKTLSQKILTGFNTNLPPAATKFPTRIRHSHKHIPYSFLDGYRIIDPSAFVDYDLQYGQIHVLRNLYDNLVSVQELCINQHYNSAKAVTTPTSQGDLVLGMGSILDDKVKRIANFGSRHQWSCGMGNMGMYGIDFLNKVIWQVKPTTSQYTGTSSLSAVALPLSKSIEKWLYELSDDIDERTDIVTAFGDNPVNFDGIVFGADRKFNEVFWTFHYRTLVMVTQPGGGINYLLTPTTKTLAFNEVIDAFTGEYSYDSCFYFNIFNDLFSQNRNSGIDTEDIYKHNQKVLPLQFYGVQKEMILSYIVNGYDEKESAVLYTKMFLSKEIEMTDMGNLIVTPTLLIDYSTKTQIGAHDWFAQITDYAMSPERLEDVYKFPVTLDGTNSNMRGKWLKTQLTYQGTDKIFIKSVVTNYILSMA